MRCEEWEARVALHAGGDLTGAEAVEVKQHLGECPGCQVLWLEIGESLAMLQSAHAELPDAAHFTRVRSRVRAELERQARPWARLAWTSGIAAAAVLLFVVLRPANLPPAPPRLLATIPAAPSPVPVKAKVAPTPAPLVRQAAAYGPRREPLTIKLQTADPNIVIYWIAD